MKKLLPLFIFCISFFCFSQEITRVEILGKIIIEGNDIDGVTVLNVSSGLGTTTNLKGEFLISAALNDSIEIRALKYQNIDITINEAILKAKRLSVFLIEEVNKLDEIVVKSKRFTGNLEADLKKINRFIPKKNTVYFGIKNKNKLKEDNYTTSKEIKSQVLEGTLVDGLNIINVVDQLLIPLFRSEVKKKKESGIPETPSKSIKYYFGSNFLSDNFNIPKHRVEEFIRFVEDDSFDLDLLNYGRELEFLELLSKKSDAFLLNKK